MKYLLITLLAVLAISTSFTSVKPMPLWLCGICEDVKKETGGSNVQWAVRVVAAKTREEAIRLFDAHIKSIKNFRGKIIKSEDTYEVRLITDKIVITR